MKKIFYEKRGRRYYPTHEYNSDFIDSFPKGSHLVISNPGGKSIRYNINPDYAPLIAASYVAEDAIVNAIVKSQEYKPSKTPITEKQQKLWKELANSFNQQDYAFIRPSAVDATKAAISTMISEAEKLMQNPAVKKAYEHFILVCELTKENKKDE